tara:strand:- start:222 stop:572 length:351 start_codon:yes stop_codon:yes gene_type:complete
MSFNYTALQSSAGLLLKKFGRQLTFTRATDGAYNPNTGTASPTTATYVKYGCVFDYSAQEIALDNIEVGDRRVFAEGHTYKVGDKVSLDSQSYRVVAVSNIQPAGTVVACNLQVRK